jgi:hypothetical protein
MNAPFSTEALSRSEIEAGLARKRRYRNVIGLGLGAAGFAAAFAGLPISVSLLFWAAGFIAWALLKGA